MELLNVFNQFLLDPNWFFFSCIECSLCQAQRFWIVGIGNPNFRWIPSKDPYGRDFVKMGLGIPRLKKFYPRVLMAESLRSGHFTRAEIPRSWDFRPSTQQVETLNSPFNICFCPSFSSLVHNFLFICFLLWLQIQLELHFHIDHLVLYLIKTFMLIILWLCLSFSTSRLSSWLLNRKSC